MQAKSTTKALTIAILLGLGAFAQVVQQDGEFIFEELTIDKPEITKENSTHFNVNQPIRNGQTSVKITLFHENCVDQIDPNDLIQVVGPNESSKTSDVPSMVPSMEPSDEASGVPSMVPTLRPSDEASGVPSMVLSLKPSDEASGVPSMVPSMAPSDEASDVPSIVPSMAPSDSQASPPSLGYTTCPGTNESPIQVVPQDGQFSFKISPSNQLCTLTLKTTVDTRETIAPLGRSYGGHDWEAVAGPYKITFQCDGTKCDGDAPLIDQINQVFVLTTFSDSISDSIDATAHSFEQSTFAVARKITSPGSIDIAARFLEQSTFGATRDMLSMWKDQTLSISELNYQFAEWTKDQIKNVPATSFRKTFREQSTTRARTVKTHGIPLHACDKNTRWHSFALNQIDSSRAHGKLEVTRTSDGNYYLFSMEGIPRTEVESVNVVGVGDLPVPGTYDICWPWTVTEAIAGRVQIKVNNICRTLEAGNPRIKFMSSNPQKPPTIITMSSPNDINNFISVPGTVKNEEFLLPDGINNPMCKTIPLGEFPVYLDFTDGTYLSFDPRLTLLNNTIEEPTPEGGGRNHLFGARCSNAPRTFLNADSCVLSNITSVCSNEVDFSDVEIELSQDNLYDLFDLTSRYVYAIAGLQAKTSPCVLNSRSRWERINESPSCPGGATSFSDATGATLMALLESPDHDNLWLRDILYTDSGQQCTISISTPSNTVDIQIIADSACWKLVHQDHYSVHDMTPWVPLHPGGADKITQFATEGGMILTYPHADDMERWENNKHQFPYLGRYQGKARFLDLPSSMQLPSVVDHFGIGIQPTNKDNFIVCGSPNEVANDHALGETGLAVSINDLMDDVHFSDRLKQRENLWTMITLSASDQLRQRVAWALSQIFAVSPETILENEQTEGYMYYYDIFVRNAFGNYFDILKEVSYK